MFSIGENHLTRRIFLLLLSLPFVATAGPCIDNKFDVAVLIGVSHPGLQEGPARLKFADNDVDLLAAKFPDTFSVITFKGEEATTRSVDDCLQKVTLNGHGKLVIFISARGYSSEELQNDGYVLTWDAAIDKLQIGIPSNGLSLKALGGKLSRRKANQQYLLLDVRRDPVESGLPNLIYNRVRSFLYPATKLIILASTDGVSKEAASAASGYYADGLGGVGGVLKPGVPLQAIFDQLTKKTKAKQTPQAPKDRPGWNLPLISSSFRRTPGPLIASLSPALFFQDPAPLMSATDQETIGKAVTAEEAGEEIFIRYGEGNHFHGDPFHQCEKTDPEFQPKRLCREEYEQAALQFDDAAKLREKLQNPDRELIWSLQERSRFCRAQVLLLRGLPDDAPAELGDPGRFVYAESHNILGISFLEMALYHEAEEEFTKAKKKAPHWAYPRHNLALSYIEHGNYTGAEKEYREAIRLTPIAAKFSQPDNPCFHGRSVMVVARPYLYYNLGVLLQRLNRLSEAQQQYCLAEASFQYRSMELDTEKEGLEMLRREAAKLNLADVDNSLGVLFEARNKGDKAPMQFKKALQNNCELSAANFNLARFGASRQKDAGKYKDLYPWLINPCQPDPKLARRATPAELYRAVITGPACAGDRASELGCQAAKKELKDLGEEP